MFHPSPARPPRSSRSPSRGSLRLVPSPRDEHEPRPPLTGILVILTVLGGLVAAMLIALVGAAAPAHGGAGTGTAAPGGHPPPGTIVRITGSAEAGFGVRFANGRWRYPPTRSEALAECGAYTNSYERVRCRVRTRTHYRGLTATQQALRWAR